MIQSWCKHIKKILPKCLQILHENINYFKKFRHFFHCFLGILKLQICLEIKSLTRLTKIKSKQSNILLPKKVSISLESFVIHFQLIRRVWKNQLKHFWLYLSILKSDERMSQSILQFWQNFYKIQNDFWRLF